MRSWPNRLIIPLIVTVLAGSLAYLFKSACTFGKYGSYDHYRNRSGMRCISDVWRSFPAETVQTNAFDQLFERVKERYPNKIGALCSPNPFPGILLPSHHYGRTLHLPLGMKSSDIPLIWDANPGHEGFAVVMFCDGGTPAYMQMAELDKCLVRVRLAGGTLGGSPIVGGE